MGCGVKKKEIIAKLLVPANKEFDSNNYVTAKTYFDELLTIYPYNTDYLERRGFCNQYIGDYRSAISDFSRAIDINGSRPSLYFFRGNNWAKLQEFEKSIEDYQQAIRLRPTLKSVYNNLGMSYLNLSQTEEACSYFKKGKELGDESAEKHYSQHCIKR